MTISAQTAVIRVTGNDATSIFAFPYPWTSQSDVHVALMTISTGAFEALTLDTHYNLSTVGDEHEVGGSITTIDDEGDPLPVPSTKVLVAWLQPALLQNLAYPASSAAKEAALDRVYKSLQYFEWQRGRSLRLADEQGPAATARGLELPSAAHRASRVLGFDADGDIQMVDGPGGAVVGGDVIAYAASIAAAGGAGLVGITDAGGHYDGGTVEAALQEAGADLAAHLMDTASAHAASAISVADGGGLFTAEDVEAALAELRTLVNALEAAVVLKGVWDASAGTFPGAGVAQAGWSYIVSVGGTVNGQVFVANDRIVAIADNASTSTYAANWHKLDYTDQVLSVAGKTGAVTLAPADTVFAATKRLAGRNTASGGAGEEVTVSQLLDWLGTAANGDIPFRTGGAWDRLPIGSNGDVLTLAGGLPSWAAPSGGGGDHFETALSALAASANVTMTIAAPCVVTFTGHGLNPLSNVCTACHFTTSGALPTGITASTTYYAVAIDANTLNVASSVANALAGTFIATSGSQSGVHSCDFRASMVTLPGGGSQDFAAILCPAGTYILNAAGHFAPASNSTTVVNYNLSISLTSATPSRIMGRFASQQFSVAGTALGSAEYNVFHIPAYRFTFGSPTIVYLVGNATFAAAGLRAGGYLAAREA